jgi:hypothetical protein
MKGARFDLSESPNATLNGAAPLHTTSRGARSPKKYGKWNGVRKQF